MFVIQASPSYFYPVLLAVRAEDGSQEEREFKARFRRLSDDELQSLMDQGLSDRQLLAEVLIGWDGITEEDGTPVEFNGAALTRMRQFAGFDFATAKAFFDSRKFESPQAGVEKN